MESRGADSVV